MENRNVYMFRNGAETRTMEFGHLETGEAYVREAGRATSPSSATTRPPTRPPSASARRRTTRSRTLLTRSAGKPTTSTSATSPRPSRSGESPTRRTRRSWRRSQIGWRAGREGRKAREGREERGRRNRATATFLARRTWACPTTPRAGGDVAAHRRRVRCGRSAGACVPRASARMQVPWDGRGLLRGHGFACGPAAAVLRMRALACGPATARLRAVGARERASGSRFASAYGRAARPQRYARLPPAPRSARMLRLSASGAALSQPARSLPACRGSHTLRATPRVTPAHRLHALRSRVGGAGGHGLVWRAGWWGRPWPRPARRPGTAAASRPTPHRTHGPSPRHAIRPQRGRPARGRWSTAALAS